MGIGSKKKMVGSLFAGKIKPVYQYHLGGVIDEIMIFVTCNMIHFLCLFMNYAWGRPEDASTIWNTKVIHSSFPIHFSIFQVLYHHISGLENH